MRHDERWWCVVFQYTYRQGRRHRLGYARAPAQEPRAESTDHERRRETRQPRLTSLSHGGGCGCKIAPGVLSKILEGTAAMPVPKELLVGIETSDDAAVYQLNDEQALIATTDFFMPIVDDPFDFGRIAATNAISDVYAMGGRPILALALVGMPINVLSTQTIARILEGGARRCAARPAFRWRAATPSTRSRRSTACRAGPRAPEARQAQCRCQAGRRAGARQAARRGCDERGLEEGRARRGRLRADDRQHHAAQYAGPDLATLPGVHALTDVTGFGLASHALEMARARCRVEIDWASVPLLPGVRELAARGLVTGASGRNWAGLWAGRCACQKASPPKTEPAHRPADQRRAAGGLRAAGRGEVRSVFARHGFERPSVVGRVVEGEAGTLAVR